MRIFVYQLCAFFLDLIHVRHSFRRRIGAIHGARTRALNKPQQPEQAPS